MGLFKNKNKGAISDSSDIEKELDTKEIKPGAGHWICVAGAFLFLMSTFGFMSCLGAIQSYLLEHQLKGQGIMKVGWILGLNLLLTLSFSWPISLKADKFSPITLGVFGAIFSAVTPLLLAQCKEYWHFMLCLGIFASIGTSVGAINALGLVGKLFPPSGRGLAMGVTVSGTSFGGVVFTLILRATFEKYGWPWSMRIVALLIACFTILGLLCWYPLRRLLPLIEEEASDEESEASVGFTSPTFIITTFGLCLVEFVLYCTNGHLPGIAKDAGFTTGNQFHLLVMLNGFSCLGRIISGPLGDTLGPYNTITGFMLVMIALAATLFKPSETTKMWIFAALWGYCSGAFAVLSPLCTGKLCRTQDVTKYFGFTSVCVGITLFAACPTSGPLLKKFGTQKLAYFCIGLLGLAAICFTVAKKFLSKSWGGICKKL
ncbi:hypothetical protein NW762_008095 [Fusarium torreyae]|uniref:Major facilitator superfamily (MFS) profile domain-containing protein n=1 Tax=Fusarium torreyae TaxID=1237075 RepID=A0A9W8VC66_9HYPO|nr:hypothetical protein NW762_008095 [Fusarium torreyae]